jgi:hypothetical protein
MVMDEQPAIRLGHVLSPDLGDREPRAPISGRIELVERVKQIHNVATLPLRAPRSALRVKAVLHTELRS